MIDPRDLYRLLAETSDENLRDRIKDLADEHFIDDMDFRADLARSCGFEPVEFPTLLMRQAD